MLPLEDAPFGEYLSILKQEDRQQDANEAEAFYLEIFETLGYSKEQLYETSFKNVVTVAQKFLEEMNRQFTTFAPSVSLSGTVLAGKDVDEEIIKKVIPIHARRHEEEKLRSLMTR